jgi:hypothetical protein
MENSNFERLLRCLKTSGAHLRPSKLRSGFLRRLAFISKFEFPYSTLINYH